MRIAPVGYAAGSPEEVLGLAGENARVTHATPDAIAGAQAVALGVYLARTDTPRDAIAKETELRFGYDLARPLDDWRQGYTFTSACDRTVPIAFRAFLESSTHEEAIRAAISGGGDSDTIACMAGALAGAYWGIPQATADGVAAALGPHLLEALLTFESRYPESLKTVTS
jgi:ADP-ribosylglycohydrolase